MVDEARSNAVVGAVVVVVVLVVVSKWIRANRSARRSNESVTPACDSAAFIHGMLPGTGTLFRDARDSVEKKM